MRASRRTKPPNSIDPLRSKRGFEAWRSNSPHARHEDRPGKTAAAVALVRIGKADVGRVSHAHRHRALGGQALAGRIKGSSAGAEVPGLNLACVEVVAQTLAAPDLIFQLQADRTLRRHLVSFQIQFPAMRGQNRAAMMNHEVIGDPGNTAHPVELNGIAPSRNQRFNPNGLIFRFFDGRPGETRDHHIKNKADEAE